MAFNPLYKKIFNRDLSEPANAAFLQQVTKEHPYFSLAHFFLLKSTDLKSRDYPTIAANAALHINNPFLLHAQLQKTTLEDGIVLPEIKPTVSIENVEEPIVEATTNIELEEPAMPLLTNLEVAETYADNALQQKEMEAADTAIENIEAVNVASAPFSNDGADEQDEDASPAVAEQSSIENTPVIHIPKPTVETADSLVFEPLHTTDYFASQGIKLSQEPLPTDKLGKQLKSFTEWLKTMKKVHDATPLVNDQVDSSVQHLAEISNKDAGVITETMAEVFLQQGKINKAKEIYVKLSLLNPDKSAYFAAKLENLK